MAIIQQDEQQKRKNVTDDVRRIEKIFTLKSQLEEEIARKIEEYEDATGLKIDRIRFYREGTIPIREGIYTELTVTIS